MNILILHGPNLQLLEGDLSFDALEAVIAAHAKTLGHQVKQVQANAEGPLLDALVAHRTWLEAIVVNPSSLAPIAWGLADALTLLKKPCIEVQLFAEAQNRGRSALKGIVGKQFHGRGVEGYLQALKALSQGVALKNRVAQTQVQPSLREGPVKTIGAKTAPAASSPTPQATAEARKKTIGRKESAEAPPAAARGKSIGPKAATSDSAPTAPTRANGNVISRALLRERLSDRLAGKVSPDAFAMWAREKWQSLQWGGQVEPGQRERLEELLMLLAATPKHTDAALLDFIARLES